MREAFNPYSVLELTAGDVGEVKEKFLNYFAIVETRNGIFEQITLK